MIQLHFNFSFKTILCWAFWKWPHFNQVSLISHASQVCNYWEEQKKICKIRDKLGRRFSESEHYGLFQYVNLRSFLTMCYIIGILCIFYFLIAKLSHSFSFIVNEMVLIATPSPSFSFSWAVLVLISAYPTGRSELYLFTRIQHDYEEGSCLDYI